MAHYMDPAQTYFESFRMNVKTICMTTFGWQLIDRYFLEWVSGKKPPQRWCEWASARPHYDDEWGHKLMSLTYCTYLFLCVTMSHLCTDGNKIPLAIPRNALHGIKKIDKATIDLNRNFTFYLRDYFSQRTVGIQLILIFLYASRFNKQLENHFF